MPPLGAFFARATLLTLIKGKELPSLPRPMRVQSLRPAPLAAPRAAAAEGPHPHSLAGGRPSAALVRAGGCGPWAANGGRAAGRTGCTRTRAGPRSPLNPSYPRLLTPALDALCAGTLGTPGLCYYKQQCSDTPDPHRPARTTAAKPTAACPSGTPRRRRLRRCPGTGPWATLPRPPVCHSCPLPGRRDAFRWAQPRSLHETSSSVMRPAAGKPPIPLSLPRRPGASPLPLGRPATARCARPRRPRRAPPPHSPPSAQAAQPLAAPSC
jgi:hypothetical protein